MTEIVFDFADIRSRMLGADKPKRKPAALMEVMPVPQSEADAARSKMWQMMAESRKCIDDRFAILPKAVERMINPPRIGVDPARPGSEQMIFCTNLPCGVWRKLNYERSPHQRLLSPQEIVEAAMLKLQQMRESHIAPIEPIDDQPVRAVRKLYDYPGEWM